MKKILFFAILLASFFIIKNLVVSIYTLWQKQDLITQAQKELEAQKKHNDELQNTYKKIHTSSFIEEESRNKLFLAKPGEQEIVIPPSLLAASKSAKGPILPEKPIFWQWVDLFL